LTEGRRKKRRNNGGKKRGNERRKSKGRKYGQGSGFSSETERRGGQNSKQAPHIPTRLYTHPLMHTLKARKG
jgi:hypothetical protein